MRKVKRNLVLGCWVLGVLLTNKAPAMPTKGLVERLRMQAQNQRLGFAIPFAAQKALSLPPEIDLSTALNRGKSDVADFVSGKSVGESDLANLPAVSEINLDHLSAEQFAYLDAFKNEATALYNRLNGLNHAPASLGSMISTATNASQVAFLAIPTALAGASLVTTLEDHASAHETMETTGETLTEAITNREIKTEEEKNKAVSKATASGAITEEINNLIGGDTNGDVAERLGAIVDKLGPVGNRRNLHDIVNDLGAVLGKDFVPQPDGYSINDALHAIRTYLDREQLNELDGSPNKPGIWEALISVLVQLNSDTIMTMPPLLTILSAGGYIPSNMNVWSHLTIFRDRLDRDQDTLKGSLNELVLAIDSTDLSEGEDYKGRLDTLIINLKGKLDAHTIGYDDINDLAGLIPLIPTPTPPEEG